MIARLKQMEPVRRIGFGLLVVAGVVSLIGSLDQHPGIPLGLFIQRVFDDFYANIGAELASIALTVLIIDRLNQRRSEDRQRNALILQMGSPDNSFAVEAVRILAAQGWLLGNALAGVRLSRANLEGANLQHVNLSYSRLGLANLRKARLTDAVLNHASLQGANLEYVCLRGADLRGANLNDAHLKGAMWDNSTLFDEETTLPDCTYWLPGTDIGRYTNPHHPDYWQPHNGRTV